MQDSLLQDAISVREQAELLLTEVDINAAFDRLAEQIQASITNEVPIFVCIMKGGLIFTSELMKRIKKPIELDYIHVDRYRKKTHGSNIHWHKEPDISLQDRHVYLLDDIFDEGITLRELIAYCKSKGASKVTSVVLLKKMLPQKFTDTEPDFIGLEIEDRYVFGCGMDYKGYWRNLHEVYAVKDG